MTIEVRQMVIRSELNDGRRAEPAPGTQAQASDPGQCCGEDEAASDRHREQRAQMRALQAQLSRLRER